MLIVFVVLSLTVRCIHKENPAIYYINSYNEGYPPSDETMRAIREAFPPENYQLTIRFLDAKRDASEERLNSDTEKFKVEIEKMQPDVVILSDDDAVKYMRDFMVDNNEIPFVFCGVNWSAEQYQLPRENVTGMLEVLPLKQAIGQLKAIYPQSKTLAVVSENSLSEQNNTLLLDTLYRNMGLKLVYFLVDDFDDWKAAFIKAQSKADLIYLPTNGAIKGWDNKTARKFVAGHISKPSFTCDDFMMPYVVFGLTKIPFEQGEWAANAAKKILAGTKPADIPFTPNSQSKAWLNPLLAKKTGVDNKDDWDQNSSIIE
jgi:ABC-type uncharacterized transport system substrate-binding protein